MADTPVAEDVRVQPPPQSRHPREQAQALPPPTALRGREDRPQEDRPVPEVLDSLSNDRPVSDTEATSALEWFLSEEPDEDGEQTHVIEINVGIGENEHWIAWTVRPIDGDVLRRIQRQTSAMRRRGRGDDLAVDQLGNLKVIVAGSVDPDIETLAEQQGKQPEAVLLRRFAKKPGLIAQLATQIMALSGFDDDDVRDALGAKN
jgi:hypothetical protein